MRSRIYGVSVKGDTRKIFNPDPQSISNLTINDKTIPALCILEKAPHLNNTDRFIHSLAKRLCVWLCVYVCMPIF